MRSLAFGQLRKGALHSARQRIFGILGLAEGERRGAVRAARRSLQEPQRQNQIVRLPFAIGAFILGLLSIKVYKSK